MPDFSHVSLRRPWKRTTAIFGEVMTLIGGRDDRVPGGASTMTKGISYFVKKFTVRSRFLSFSQDAWRNSTANGVSPRRSLAFTISSRDSFDGKNQRGYWRKTAPSFPELRRGSIPSRNLLQISFSTSFGRSRA